MADNYWTRAARRHGVSRRRFLAGAALTGAGLLAACRKSDNQSGQSAGTPAKGGSLTQGIWGTDAKSFHPFLTTDSQSGSYQGYIYGVSLTQRDPKTLDVIPFGADHWTISDDKKIYTFTLKDLKWSDGAPITTDDFVWTYEQARKPENKYPYVENLDKIASYVAKDPKTLVVTLTDALVVGLQLSDVITPLPRHVWEKYPWGDPTKNPEIQNPTVAGGMWKLKEWKRDDHATFIANDLYFDGRPNIDTMTVRVFGTPEITFQALKAGKIDFSSFQPADHASAKKLSNVAVYDWYPAAGQYGYIGFNLRHAALQNAQVRRAIAYASDRKGIIESALFGLGKPVYAGFVQESPVYSPDVEHYDFSVDKAKDLFKQAGYTLDSGKKLVKDGKQLSLKLLYPTTSKPRQAIATILKQQLGDLGIALDVQGLEFQTYVSTIQSEPFDWDLQLGVWSTDIDPYWSYQLWSEKSIPDLNAGAYVNKQVESLFTQGSKAFDPTKSKEIYRQIQQILAGDAPYAFLYEPMSYAGVNDKVGGIVPSPLGLEYNINKWYVKK